MVPKFGSYGNWIINTRKVLKCGAGEKWRSDGPIVWGNEALHGVEEERITLHIRTKEGCLDWSHLAWELSSETYYWRKDRKKDRSDGGTRKNIQAATGWLWVKYLILDTERGSTRSNYVGKKLWKGLWICRQRDYGRTELILPIRTLFKIHYNGPHLSKLPLQYYVLTYLLHGAESFLSSKLACS